MKVIEGGITAPKGFWASGIHSGIKYRNKDLALICSQLPSVACGVFTQNRVQAAPVKLTSKRLGNGRAQAIVINSGNANCCTGKPGLRDAEDICLKTAEALALSPEDVLTASTGVIGKRLPLKKILAAIDSLTKKLSRQGGLDAARAIMTTDSKAKQVAVELKLGKFLVRIGGIAKGAGMIQPNMATMLAFITTDILIDRKQLKAALQQAVDNSFNLITVDGDTSTNDMVLVLANGLAANSKLNAKELQAFKQAVNFVCLNLAKMIIQDGEGATKIFEVQVEQARSLAQAKKIAFKIANSPLVKTTIFGENPNWGRIAACAGAADQLVKESSLNIYLGGIKVLSNGTAKKHDQQKLRNIFKQDEIKIKVSLGLGSSSVQVLSCDLTNKYIKINAEY